MSTYKPNPGISKHGGSYIYSALCDSCGLKMRNIDLRLRWDGLWCCSDDWEVRHPLDFYRTRNDTHKLPFIRSDGNVADPQLTWTPVVTNLTLTAFDKETFAGDATGFYTLDTTDTGYSAINPGTYTNGSTTCKYVLARSTHPSFSDSTIKLDTPEPRSVSSATSATITLPSSPTVKGIYTVIANGREIAAGTILAGSSTLSLTNWAGKIGNVFFSGYYGT